MTVAPRILAALTLAMALTLACADPTQAMVGQGGPKATDLQTDNGPAAEPQASEPADDASRIGIVKTPQGIVIQPPANGKGRQ